MKYKRDFHTRLGYAVAAGLVALMTLTGVCNDWLAGETNWSGILFLGLLAWFTLCDRYESAPGELTQDGVYVRHFFRKRFYPWTKIRQAGILLRCVKAGHYPELVLVKPNGYPRKPGDTAFLIRNKFRLIHIPYNLQTLGYITAFYGPLDFDLTDGKRE